MLASQREELDAKCQFCGAVWKSDGAGNRVLAPGERGKEAEDGFILEAFPSSFLELLAPENRQIFLGHCLQNTRFSYQA
jgi:hypothetical protein